MTHLPMTLRMTFAALALLSQTGCVAAIPIAAQLISGASSTAQLCSMAKMPGQTSSLCEHMPFGFGGQSSVAAATPTPRRLPNGTIVDASVR